MPTAPDLHPAGVVQYCVCNEGIRSKTFNVSERAFSHNVRSSCRVRRTCRCSGVDDYTPGSTKGCCSKDCTVEFGRDVSRTSTRPWTLGGPLRRSSSHRPPGVPSIGVGHPFRKRSTVAMPASGDGPGPRCGRPKQQGGRQGEGQGDCAATRSRQSCLRIGNDAVYATLCVGRCKAGHRSHLLNQVGPIVATDAIVAGGGQEDTASFGALGTQIAIGRPARRAKQPIEFIAQYRLCGGRICR